MITNVLYDHIKTALTTAGITTTLIYGSAERAKPPYIIMRKISDPEQPDTMSDVQGTNGNALFSFSGYAGGVNSLQQEKNINAVKEVVKTIKGTIGTTEKYLISSNRCGGVIPLGEGATLAVWGAVFDMAISWKAV